MTTAPLATVPTGAVDLATPAGCIDAAINVQNNYKESMLLIVEKWTAPKDWGGHALPIEQLAEAIKRSPKTLKTDYVSVLRKQGRLPSSPLARERPGQPTIRAGHPAPIVENSTPPNSSWSERSTLKWEPASPNPPTTVYEAEIVIDDPIVLSHAEPVSFSESRPQPYRNPAAVERELTDQVGSEDYQRVIQLVDDISVILKQHAFRGTFSISEWSSCLGGFQSLAAVASAQHNNVQQYAGNEQRVNWA